MKNFNHKKNNMYMLIKYYTYILVGFFFLFFIFYTIGTIKITIDFEDLEPFKYHLPVYYKGFRLGHTTKVRPDKDYKSTLVDTRIVLKNLTLPANTTAILKRKDKKDYIELVYPNAPYIEKLKHNDTIKGSIGLNFEHYLQSQANNGGLDEIKNNVNKTIISAGETFNALTEMLNVATEILEDVRPVIKDSALELNTTTKNLANLSSELKKSVDKGYLESFLYNLDRSSNNLVATTNNFSSLSDNFNKESTRLTNCLLQKLNILVSNINQIVIGVGETLKKRFGGIRLMFGKMQ